MQLKQLLYLKTVAETQSIRKASSQLFVSQQAISQALLAMENEYNVQLLKRSVHGVTLTEAGKYAVAVAEQILALSDDLERYFKECTTIRQSNQLQIAVTPYRTFIDYILPEIKIKFIQRYPEISLAVQPVSSDELIEALCAQTADLGFLGLPYIDNKPLLHIPSELQFFPLISCKYGVLVGTASPLNHFRTLSIKSILQYPIIFLQEQIDSCLENYIPYRMLSHFGPCQTVIADSVKFYSKLIGENMGIGLAVDCDFDNPPDNEVVLKPLRENVSTSLGYLLHRDRLDDMYIKHFLTLLQNQNLR